MSKFKPTVYQQAIFDWFQNGSGNLIIQAVAGSGKTTTIINALEFIPPKDSVLMLAFNVSIRDELQDRVTKLRDKKGASNVANITVKTQNGAGYKAVKDFAQKKGIKVSIKQNKDSQYISEIIRSLTEKAEKKNERSKSTVKGTTKEEKDWNKNKFYYTDIYKTLFNDSAIEKLGMWTTHSLAEALRDNKISMKNAQNLLQSSSNKFEYTLDEFLKREQNQTYRSMGKASQFIVYLKSLKITSKTLISTPKSIVYNSSGIPILDKDKCFIPRSYKIVINNIMNQPSDPDLPDLTLTSAKNFFSSLVSKIVGLAKSNGFDVTEIVPKATKKYWYRLVYYYMIVRSDSVGDSLNSEFVIKSAMDVFKLSINNIEEITYDDQLFLPAYYDKMKPTKYDWVIIDECQDTNLVTQLLLEKSLNPKGRLVAIGDRAQAIYGFRGADANAMNKLTDRFNCKELPLSECFRCSKEIIKYAQRHMPIIQARLDAPRGIVEKGGFLGSTLKQSDIPYHQVIKNPKVSSAVICRTNRPLEALARQLLITDTPFYFLGKDLGDRVIFTIKSMYNEFLKKKNEPLVKPAEWNTVNIQRIKESLLDLSRFQQGRIDDGMDINPNAFVHELIQLTLKKKPIEVRNSDDIVIDEYHTFEQLEQTIRQQFTDNVSHDKIGLCTAHRSKGKEFFRVILLDYDKTFIQRESDLRDWMKTQEINMAYVAITRAERELIFVRLENKLILDMDEQDSSKPVYKFNTLDIELDAQYSGTIADDLFVYEGFDIDEDPMSEVKTV